MTKPAAHADPNSGLLKNEPAMVTALGLWLAGYIGTLLVARYHLLTAGQWSAIAVELTGVITFVIAVVAGWLLRRCIVPAWKWAEAEAQRDGVTVPDWAGLSTATGTLAGSSIYQAGQPPSDDSEPPVSSQVRTAADILAEADAIHPEQTPAATPPAADAAAEPVQPATA